MQPPRASSALLCGAGVVTAFGGLPASELPLEPELEPASASGAPASRHCVLGVNEPADAQSVPSSWEIAGQAAGHTLPTLVVVAQASGPRKH
ncbi:MAG TPA: hypothetical protein VGM44_05525, partial [Polyangiaceae bacterium]